MELRQPTAGEGGAVSPRPASAVVPGEPQAVTVSSDGARVVFLRQDSPAGGGFRLWTFDVATGGERPVEGTEGVEAYALDGAGRLAAATCGDELVVADLVAGAARRLPAAGPVRDPQPDPSGRLVAYLTGGALRVLDLAGGADTLLAAEGPAVAWGATDTVAAADFGRRHGYWWAPGSGSVLAARVDTARVPGGQPVAGGPNAEVTLHVLDLDGGWVDVHWDRETYPYLVAVSWSDVGGPLVTVLRRLQQHGLVLAVDPRTGETQVHAELADPRWVEPVEGTPAYLTDGRVLIGGELAHDGYDARCLFADGGLLTPASLYVRRVCGRLGTDLLIEGSEGEPSQQHLYRVGTRATASTVEVRRITTEPGWHRGHAAAETLALGSASLDREGTQWTVYSGESEVGRLTSRAAATPAPRPALERVTDRRLPAGVLYPGSHVAGRRLPVLVEAHGAPGRQEVIAARGAWTRRQWWADAGFAVVVIDNRGTPGIAPSFEKVIHRRLADVILSDQADALVAVAEKHPDLDLGRVGIRGAGFGGWLAALATLRRPDLYRCGVAEAPIADWSLYSTAFTERYLGLPGDAGELYGHASLLESAAEPVHTRGGARPLLLVGDPARPATAEHGRRLAAAMAQGNRPLWTIPEPDPAAELAFLRTHLLP